MSRISAHVYCAYHSELDTEWSRGFIRNHYDRLYFIESGEAVIATNEQEITLKPGCCYLIASNLLHRHSCTSNVGIHWCHFQTILDGFRDLFQEIDVPLEARPENTNAYRNIFTSLENTMHDRNSWCHLQRTALLLQLIQPHLKLADPASKKITEERRRFLPVLKYIDTHLNESIPIGDLAKLLGLNPEYFSRYFRKHFKIPPKQYILNKRILYAQKRLCQTDAPVQDIGMNCGFSDPYHFSKSFKTITGIPPTEYRRRFQQQETHPAKNS